MLCYKVRLDLGFSPYHFHLMMKSHVRIILEVSTSQETNQKGSYSYNLQNHKLHSAKL